MTRSSAIKTVIEPGIRLPVRRWRICAWPKVADSTLRSEQLRQIGEAQKLFDAGGEIGELEAAEAFI